MEGDGRIIAARGLPHVQSIATLRLIGIVAAATRGCNTSRVSFIDALDAQVRLKRVCCPSENVRCHSFYAARTMAASPQECVDWQRRDLSPRETLNAHEEGGHESRDSRGSRAPTMIINKFLLFCGADDRGSHSFPVDGSSHQLCISAACSGQCSKSEPCPCTT